MTLETTLRTSRDSGRKLLVPYVTGGITADWADYVRGYQDAGADAIEIGLPFSDPMLDGTTIQQASDRALARGATVGGILADLTAIRRELTVPLVAMTYANLVVRDGAARFCERLAAAGFAGLIVPDVPLDELGGHDVLDSPSELDSPGELGGLGDVAARTGIDLVLLAAPSTGPARLRDICERSRGFVYAVSVMGTTGERAELAGTAEQLAADAKACTDRPVLTGFGISTPAQALGACRTADGVVIASALMRRVLGGATPAGLGEDLRAVRDELG